MINFDTQLIDAARNGNLDLVKQLIENGADIHAEDDLALRYASSRGYLGVVKYLISNGADVHAESDEALINASFNGHLELVKYLIDQGADIHANNDYALIWASSRDHLEVVKYLISKGADITELMDVPEDVQEIVIKNDVRNIKYIKNLRSDFKEKYRHLLTGSGFGLFEDE